MPLFCFRRALASLAAVLAVAGCGSRPSAAVGGGEAPKPPIRLSIAVASDLQSVLPVLIRDYRKEAPAIEIEASYGASRQLANQIEQGAPFDLFLSADLKLVDRLGASKAVDVGSIRPYAIGSLVLAAHRQTGSMIAGLDDLKRPEVKKIAIANPETAPYGSAARAALKRAGLWDVLQPKIVIAASVRQALQFVQTGNAEAGLVGRATADGPEVVVSVIDPSLYPSIVQGLGIVSRSTRKGAAGRFVQYLLSPKGQSTFQSFGFRPPDPSTLDNPQ